MNTVEVSQVGHKRREAMEEYKRGNKPQAVQILKEVTRAFPDCCEVYNDLGCILWEMGRRWSAVSHLKRAVRAEPGNRNAATNLEAMSAVIDNTEREESLSHSAYCFDGWRMKNAHVLPWVGTQGNEFFRQAHVDASQALELQDPEDLDKAMWRHWVISYSIRHAIEFSGLKDFLAVECGVSDGLSTFFELRELTGHRLVQTIERFQMHLYDSWEPMREENLLPSERNLVGKYAKHDIRRVKSNLSEFADDIVFHPGFIPDTLSTPFPDHKPVVYLHIDLNSVMPTVAALDFFVPRMPKGSVVLFDDFGWEGYNTTKQAVVDFFASKPGSLMPFPTGQAIYFGNC
jgi:hypothetical protein